MTRTANRTRLIGIAVSTALATTALTGCTTGGGTRADVSASRAESALAAGKTDKAIRNAEEAVLVDPRYAAYRATLGNAYLNAGRFKSAATTLDDAMSLGDTSPRTALSLALAYIGAGNQRQAVAVGMLEDVAFVADGDILGKGTCAPFSRCRCKRVHRLTPPGPGWRRTA